MASIAILIGTPSGTRLMAASSERDAALMVEGLLLELPRTALPAPLWVQCADRDVAKRLTDYFTGLQTELSTGVSV